MATLVQNFIGGDCVHSSTPGTTPVYNPSQGQVIAEIPSGGEEDVNQAVAAAKDAFVGWAETPAVERARILFRYKHLLEEDFESLARGVTREHGKTIEEARGDVR